MDPFYTFEGAEPGDFNLWREAMLWFFRKVCKTSTRLPSPLRLQAAARGALGAAWLRTTAPCAAR